MGEIGYWLSVTIGGVLLNLLAPLGCRVLEWLLTGGRGDEASGPWP